MMDFFYIDRERAVKLILGLIVIGAAVFLLAPRFLGGTEKANAAANNRVVAVYQTWRIKVGSRPQLLKSNPRRLVKLLNQDRQLPPIGLQIGTKAPQLEGKVFLTTLTGKNNQFQAVSRLPSGQACVLTARGYAPPAINC